MKAKQLLHNWPTSTIFSNRMEYSFWKSKKKCKCREGGNGYILRLGLGVANIIGGFSLEVEGAFYSSMNKVEPTQHYSATSLTIKSNYVFFCTTTAQYWEAKRRIEILDLTGRDSGGSLGVAPPLWGTNIINVCVFFKWRLDCPPSLFQRPQCRIAYQTLHLGYKQIQSVTPLSLPKS